VTAARHRQLRRLSQEAAELDAIAESSQLVHWIRTGRLRA
jgi:hypothetical protein